MLSGVFGQHARSRVATPDGTHSADGSGGLADERPASTRHVDERDSKTRSLKRARSFDLELGACPRTSNVFGKPGAAITRQSNCLHNFAALDRAGYRWVRRNILRLPCMLLPEGAALSLETSGSPQR